MRSHQDKDNLFTLHSTQSTTVQRASVSQRGFVEILICFKLRGVGFSLEYYYFIFFYVSLSSSFNWLETDFLEIRSSRMEKLFVLFSAV